MSNTSKIKVAVLAGARSTEHEVSLASAYNIANAIDREKYEVFIVGISPDGVWKQYDPQSFVENPTDFASIRLGQPISGRIGVTQSSPTFYDLDNGGQELFSVDVVFPAVLGNYAEDGTMQGLLRIMDVPFTTPDVLGSAAAMDKDMMKRLFIQAGIPTQKFKLARKNLPRPSYEDLIDELGRVMFIKPANNGSSVGVYKVDSAADFDRYLERAFEYDVKVLIEEAVDGREVELSMKGNIGSQQISHTVGEIVEKKEGDFYSYDNKYVSSDNVDLITDTDVTEDQRALMQELSVRACEALECEGFSRVDFFIRDSDGQVLLNEINTMPGFTQISMYPKLWVQSGVSYGDLVDELLQLAIQRHAFRIEPIVTNAAEVLRREQG